MKILHLTLCLVRVKAFPENILFSGNAIFRKGKCFHVFGCISKNFPKNIFWCLEKKKEKTNPNKPKQTQKKEKTARSHRSSIDDRNRWAVWSTSALVGRSHRSSIASLIDRRAHLSNDRTARRSTNSAIDNRCSLIWALSSLSLSLSLSQSLSLFPKIIWSENEGVKSFTGQRWKFRSTGSHFPENEIYRCCQTPEFGGKWFPKIIFPQNKHTLNWQWKKKIKIAN